MSHYYTEIPAKSPRIQKLIDHLYAKMPEIESDRAVLLTEEGVISVHRAHLPSAAKKGDSVSYSNGGYSLRRAENDDIGGKVRDKLHKMLTGEND